jgi:hypothetical protein
LTYFIQEQIIKDVQFAIQRQAIQGNSESICKILETVARSNFDYWYGVACELHSKKMFYEAFDCLQVAEGYIDPSDEDSNDLYREVIYTLVNAADQTGDKYFINQAILIVETVGTRYYNEGDLNFKLEMLIYLNSGISKVLLCIEDIFDKGFKIKIKLDPYSLGINNLDGIENFSHLAEAYMWLNQPAEAFRVWSKLLKLESKNFDNKLCNAIYILNWYADSRGYDDESFLSDGFERSK